MTDTASIPGDMTPEPEHGQTGRLAAATLARAHARLAAIRAYFKKTGPVSAKTSDNLRHELDAQNVWALEDDPNDAEVTLLHLLQASTEALRAKGKETHRLHIHHLIECAFLEQEALRAITALWPATYSHALTTEHLQMVEAATRPYLSEQGLKALDELAAEAEQKERLPDYRASSFLHYDQTDRQKGDPPSEAGFVQAQRYLEAITDDFLNAPFRWEITPADLAARLAHHNAAGRKEAGQQGQPYTNTTMVQLYALSRRRIAALEDTGWHLTHLYRPLCALDRLIRKAATIENAMLNTVSTLLASSLSAGK